MKPAVGAVIPERVDVPELNSPDADPTPSASLKFPPPLTVTVAPVLVKKVK